MKLLSNSVNLSTVNRIAKFEDSNNYKMVGGVRLCHLDSLSAPVLGASLLEQVSGTVKVGVFNIFPRIRQLRLERFRTFRAELTFTRSKFNKLSFSQKQFLAASGTQILGGPPANATLKTLTAPRTQLKSITGATPIRSFAVPFTLSVFPPALMPKWTATAKTFRLGILLNLQTSRAVPKASPLTVSKFEFYRVHLTSYLKLMVAK